LYYDVMSGTRQQIAERTRIGTSPCYGWFGEACSPLILDYILPRVLGGTKTGNTIAFAEAIPYFGMLEDTEVTAFEHRDFMVDKFVLRGGAYKQGDESEPEKLEMLIHAIGRDIVKDVTFPASPPALAVTGNSTPYSFTDMCDQEGGTFLILGDDRKIYDFDLMIVNAVNATYHQCVTATSLRPTDFIVKLDFTTDWNDANEDLYDMPLPGEAATIKFVNGPYSIQFDIGAFQSPIRGPSIRGRQRIILEKTGFGRRLGTTPSIGAVNDSSV
jgi:hypothetical protein